MPKQKFTKQFRLQISRKKHKQIEKNTTKLGHYMPKQKEHCYESYDNSVAR